MPPFNVSSPTQLTAGAELRDLHRRRLGGQKRRDQEVTKLSVNYGTPRRFLFTPVQQYVVFGMLFPPVVFLPTRHRGAAGGGREAGEGEARRHVGWLLYPSVAYL